MSRTRLKSKKPNDFSFKPRIIILGDGETERDYVKRLNQLKMFKNISIRFEKGTESNFHTKLKEHLNNQDNVLLILDIDNVRDHTKKYGKIQNIIKKYSNQVFYNNYSFETWLLNHKVNYSKAVTNQSDYNPMMKNCFSVESWFSNKNQNNRNKVMNSISQADINNACQNIKNINKNKWDYNPSSNMDKLIILLKNKN